MFGVQAIIIVNTQGFPKATEIIWECWSIVFVDIANEISLTMKLHYTIAAGSPRRATNAKLQYFHGRALIWFTLRKTKHVDDNVGKSVTIFWQFTAL